MKTRLHTTKISVDITLEEGALVGELAGRFCGDTGDKYEMSRVCKE